MVRLLKTLTPMGTGLASFQGGSLRNAIPREAFVTHTVPADQVDRVAATVDAHLEIFRSELAEVEPSLILTLSAAEQAAADMMPATEMQRWLDALHVSPNDIHRMSLSVEGVAETSNNLAVVTIEDGTIKVENMLRSLVDSAKDEQACTAYWELRSKLKVLTPAGRQIPHQLF